MPFPARRPWRSALLALPVVMLVGATPARAADPVTVRIDNFTFGPETVVVPPGTAVTWVNGDDIPHTVVAQDKRFRSKTLDTDESFTFVFETPGEYAYFCSLHPHMTGKVVVRPSAG